MRHPTRLSGLATLFLSALGSASALTVVPSAATLNTYWNPSDVTTPSAAFWECALNIYQNAAQTDYTTIFFDYTTSTRSLVYRNSVLDEGSDWYFVSVGQSFNWAEISQGGYTVFGGADQSFTVPYGDFYLGFATGQGFTPPITSGNSTPNRSVLGWAHLQASAAGIVLVDSAAAYDAGSIIVGTQTATPIPEPASAAALAGFAALAAPALRRRRRG